MFMIIEKPSAGVARVIVHFKGVQGPEEMPHHSAKLADEYNYSGGHQLCMIHVILFLKGGAYPHDNILLGAL